MSNQTDGVTGRDLRIVCKWTDILDGYLSQLTSWKTNMTESSIRYLGSLVLSIHIINCGSQFCVTVL